MIPPFDDSGNLPPGIHPATLAEIEERFGQECELRQVQMQSVRWLVDLAREAGAARIVLNGSFTTDVFEPNDVDCVVLLPDEAIINEHALEELLEGLPFLDLAIAGPELFHDYVTNVYGSDRQRVLKGMVEVIDDAKK